MPTCEHCPDPAVARQEEARSLDLLAAELSTAGVFTPREREAVTAYALRSQRFIDDAEPRPLLAAQVGTIASCRTGTERFTLPVGAAWEQVRDEFGSYAWTVIAGGVLFPAEPSLEVRYQLAD